MNEAKKPDNVVYNPVSREYDAALSVQGKEKFRGIE